MQLTQYVKWETPNEERDFLNLAKQYTNDTEFIEIAAKKFGVDKLTIKVAMLRFRKKIEKIRNTNN